MKRVPSAILLLGVVALLPLGGCPPNGGTTTGDEVAKLVAFQSSNELVSYFRTQASTRYERGGFLPTLFGAPANTADSGGAAEATGAQDASSGGQTYTTTNLQESGVDEADVVKSDGEYFYIANGQTLSIVRADPAALQEVATLDLGFWSSDMYLIDDQLIVLGSQTSDTGVGPAIAMEIWPPYYIGNEIVVAQVDVSDPAAPAIEQQLSMDGSLVTSRLTSGKLIIVSTILPAVPDTGFLGINLVTLEDVLPTAKTRGGSDVLVPWENWLRPASPDGYYMTAIVTIDAANVETIVGSTAVLANAGTIYVSPEALYLTDSEYDPADNYREKTAVHKFTFDADGVATYVASGSVPGRLLNQFSLGEHEGYLRMATYVDVGFFVGDDIAVDGSISSGGGVATDTATSPPSDGETAVAEEGDPQTQQAADESPPAEPYNAVYVLGQNEAALDVIGSVENIAPGERIYAARFLADKGFLVTFKQIDPFFVVDLADPASPQVVGELKVPGYSDYLHPISDTRILGVGRSTVSTGFGGVAPDAVQVSLFDISDVSNPTLLDQMEIGGQGSYSDVSYTHKAFTYLADSQVLALPVYLFDESSNESLYVYGFQGVVCLKLDLETGLSEMGRLASVAPEEALWHYPQWQRAAIVGDVVYAIDPSGVSAAALDDFSATSQTTIRGDVYYDAYVDAGVSEDGAGSAGSTEPSSP